MKPRALTRPAPRAHMAVATLRLRVRSTAVETGRLRRGRSSRTKEQERVRKWDGLARMEGRELI